MTWSNDFDDRELVKHYVVTYMTCELCDSAYQRGDIQLLDEPEDGAWALVVTCPHCGTTGLILAITNPIDDDDVMSEPLIASRWDPGLAPLTEQDVREWCAFLDDFTGDLNDLLQTHDRG